MTRTAAPLVFASGFCALIYQIVWTREFRLVFGASTAASAAVVAIFIAGLGLGGLYFGRRVERSAQPLQFYANLELAIAASSALTPWLLRLARGVYIASGGSIALGPAGATLVRLLLATVVIGGPVFLMGGTLPAIARAVETREDFTRRGVALVYGVNTLGAVLGCLLASFALLEIFGSRLSLWIACLLNALVALIARSLARGIGTQAAVVAVAAEAGTDPATGARGEERAIPRWLVLSSAAVVGFAFFLMELVWYRLLGPLLGGTIFTFGLILAVALAGIGVGSTLYTLVLSRRSALLSGFALTCVLEAACIALPYALGDRIALWTLALRSLGGLGFDGLLFGWALIAGLVVFPAALVSGLQFPMLIALLGSGREQVARDVGLAYAANTVGAIAGALAGGFGLMPLLGAVGCWKLVSFSLCAWGGLAAMVAARGEGMRVRLVWAGGLVALALLMLGSQGPTAAWRHTPIGAGRVPTSAVSKPNMARGFVAQYRRDIVWQADGVESSVALDGGDGLAFIVNGKSDGHARGDAATQVMSGLLGVALQPHFERAMVIGLGTGSTAGWLGAVPGIERVDVAEIEPAILEVAERCAPVSEDALANPKVHVFLGDGRELLAVSRSQYDVIFSEPSNPYRAGIASMYTREFYQAVSQRLSRDGVFVQWMQAYETDSHTMQTIYATLGSVFPYIETWNGVPRDLLLVASHRKPVHDVAALRERLAREPLARAQRTSWNSEGVEGFFAHYVANAAFARGARDSFQGILNADDLAPVEFGYSRTVGGDPGAAAESMLRAARERGQTRALTTGGTVDWERVAFEREAFATAMGYGGDLTLLAPRYHPRLDVLARWRTGDMAGALAAARRLPPEASAAPIALERLARAELLAHAGDPEAEARIAELAQRRPTEAAALRAVWLQRSGRLDEAGAAYEDALRRYRRDPWPVLETMARAIAAAGELGSASPQHARRMMKLLDQPFAVRVNEGARRQARSRIARALGPGDRACLNEFAELEPHVPWGRGALEFRLACYAAHHSPLLPRARDDLDQFLAGEVTPFSALLR